MSFIKILSGSRNLYQRDYVTNCSVITLICHGYSVITHLALKIRSSVKKPLLIKRVNRSELNVDNWNDNCEAKSEANSPRTLRGLQVDFSLTRNVSYAVR